MKNKTLKELVEELKTNKKAALEKEPPIPCLGRWCHSQDGSDYDCDYEFAGAIHCEDCIVNGGRYDPRIDYKEEE